MAENTPTPDTAAPAAVTAPAMPAVERMSVPASAVFDDNDVAIAGTPPIVDKTSDDADAAAAAEAAKPAAATPEAKAAAEAAKPAAATPEAKAAAEAAKPAAATPEAKVKVGGKEYSVEELEKLIANPPAAQPAAQPAAAAPAAQKVPTAEELAAQAKEVAARETEWCETFLKNTKIGVNFSKEDVEKILEGGDEAAKVLSDRFAPALAKAVLETRKSIYSELNPYFEQANAAMRPLLEQQVQLERVATEQVFVSRHAEFNDPNVLAKARSVAEALVSQYPKETNAMTREQFVDEVAAQTDRLLQADYKFLNPQAKDTWRDALKTGKAAPAAQPAAQPAAAAAQPAAQPAAAAPAVKPASAPAANSPAASPASGGGLPTDKQWHRDTAASLVD